MIKAVIFDFGGPIMAWRPDEIVQKHEDHRNLQRDTIRDILHGYLTSGVSGKHSTIAEYYKENPPPINITVEELNEILDEMNATMQIRPEVIAYIQTLKPQYKIGLLSNFSAGLGDFLRDMFNIYHLFDAVVSSHDVKMIKPNSDIYLHALTVLGVKPEEAVFVDDRQENVDAAAALGMRVVLCEHSEKMFQESQKMIADIDQILHADEEVSE